MRKTLLFMLTLVMLISAGAVYGAYQREGQCQVFYRDGGQREGDLEFLSTHSGRISFYNSPKEPLNRIWMLNFVENRWNYPQEQAKLHPKGADTIVYRDGSIDYVYIFSWSTRRRLFYLKTRATDREQNNQTIRVNQIARVYFGGNNIPKAFRSQPQAPATPPPPPQISETFPAISVEVSSEGKSIRINWDGYNGPNNSFRFNGKWYSGSQIDRIFLGNHNEDLQDSRRSNTFVTILVDDGRILQDRLNGISNNHMIFENLKPVALKSVLVIIPPSGNASGGRRVIRHKR